jgi:hypothetical protein
LRLQPRLASTIHGSSAWQTLQRGTPDGLARTRFFVPQLGQVVIVLRWAIAGRLVAYAVPA